LTEQINEGDLNTFYVGYDINDNGESIYRWRDFTNILLNVIPEFAFGHHLEVNTQNAVEMVSEAAKSIYKIREFIEVKALYDADEAIEDDDETKKYLRRGEFGELILHLLLRDYHETIPLISKIYFKDSYGHTVHGFDAVHVNEETKTLWLGESKLYFNGRRGVDALIRDIKEHINSDYLESEFSIIRKKLLIAEENEERNYWINLMSNKTKLSEVLDSIKIPLLCTFSCDIFSQHSEETQEFLNQIEYLVRELKIHFEEKDDHPLKDRLDIILILLPIKCKKELIRRLHNKLYMLQRIDSDE